MSANRPPWEGIIKDGPDRGKTRGIPKFEDTTGLNSDTYCALVTIIEMLDIVHDRLKGIENEIGVKNKLEELLSNTSGNK